MERKKKTHIAWFVFFYPGVSTHRFNIYIYDRDANQIPKEVKIPQLSGNDSFFNPAHQSLNVTHYQSSGPFLCNPIFFYLLSFVGSAFPSKL